MITEAIISTVFNTMSKFLASVIDLVLGALGMPEFSIPIPSPFWFIIAYLMQVVLVVWPIALGWWVWRQIKA